jgi:hypothetical protein
MFKSGCQVLLRSLQLWGCSQTPSASPPIGQAEYPTHHDSKNQDQECPAHQLGLGEAYPGQDNVCPWGVDQSPNGLVPERRGRIWHHPRGHGLLKDLLKFNTGPVPLMYKTNRKISNLKSFRCFEDQIPHFFGRRSLPLCRCAFFLYWQCFGTRSG